MGSARVIATRTYEKRVAKFRNEWCPESQMIGLRFGEGRPSRRSRIARDIIAGLKEAVAFSRGETALSVRIVKVPETIDTRTIRAQLGLSQTEFASQYGFSVRTIQQWEQGQSAPDSAIRAYLTVISRNPEAVIDALHAE